jgi:protein SCO1/2
MMNTVQASPKFILWVAPLAALLAIVAALVVSSAEMSRRDVAVLGTVPKFSFTDQHGQPFGLEEMKGKINVVGFMFIRCRSICPFMAERIVELDELYRYSDKVQFVSISVDPDHDSARIRREYIDDHGVSQERWHYLRAPIDEVANLMEEGFMLAAENLPGGHPSHFILVDEYGQIRGYYSYDDPKDLELLRRHIRLLARGEA